MLHPCQSELDYTSSDSTAQNQWYLHVVPHGVFLIFHMEEHYYSSFASIEQGRTHQFFFCTGQPGDTWGQWQVAMRQLEADAKRDFEFALKPGHSAKMRFAATGTDDFCNPETHWFMPCWSMLNLVKLSIFGGDLTWCSSATFWMNPNKHG